MQACIEATRLTMKRRTDEPEAFFRIVGKDVGSLGPARYRAGYRLRDTGKVICTVELPASVTESTVYGHSKLAIAATTNGYIQSSVVGLASLNGTTPVAAEPIDLLIEHVTAVENLRLEEATVEDLKMLLQRLERSVSLAKEAIARLDAVPGSQLARLKTMEA
jgi:hypothetical protein